MSRLRQEIQEVLELGGLSVKELVKRVVRSVYENNCLGQAAQLAYYFLFALFPFLLFLTTLLGYLPLPNFMNELQAVLAGVMPGETLALMQDNVHGLIQNQRGGLLSFGIITALWTSSSAVMAIMDNLNRAYGVKEGRPLWKVWGLALLLVLGLSVFLLLSLILLMFGPYIGSWLARQVGLGNVFELVWNILRWPVIVMLLIFTMAIIYYMTPDVEQEWKWITPGSIVAMTAWILTSLGFSYYVANFGSYNKIYGSIGTVIVLMTWMYLLGFFILLGGEINAEIEHSAKSGKNPGQKTLSDTALARRI
jgi:membrane protein